MLEEKLQSAKKESISSAYKFLLIGAGFLILILLLIALGSFWQSSQVADPAQETSIETRPAAEEVTNTPPKLDPSSQTSEETEAEREAFKNELTAFDQELTPRIEEARLAQWDAEGTEQIFANRNEALSLFGQGKYGSARQKLAATAEQAETLLKKQEKAFQSAMQEARTAYDSDLAEQAALHIGKALGISPDSVVANSLKRKIDQLPEVLDLIRDAEVARVENDLLKEAQILQDIVRMDPDRKAQSDRLVEVRRALIDMQFAENIRQGLSAVQSRDPANARRYLEQAGNLKPNNPELDLLGNKILALEKQLRLEAAITAFQDAAEADDWQLAQKSLTAVKQENPNNKDVLDGLQLAGEINSLSSQMASMISDEHRLSSKKVRNQAEDTILKAGIVGHFSPRLRDMASSLETKIAQYQIDVPVTVISDNETDIIVVGVGQVGQTSSREIKLKPGIYVFEGRRHGYKSKRVELKISAGSSSANVTVICDEPI